MGIGRSVKKIAKGSPIARPKLELGYMLGLIVSIVVVLACWGAAKWVLARSKRVVGQATPGPSGMGDIRGALGV